MANELIINASLPETRIALLEKGEIQELLIERASDKGIVGNIYKGRVTRVLPGMQAAFVDIGLEKAAFLYVDDVYVHPKIWADQEEVNETTTGDSEAISKELTEVAPANLGEAQETLETQLGTSLESFVAESLLEAMDQPDVSSFDEDESQDPPAEMGRDPQDVESDSSDLVVLQAKETDSEKDQLVLENVTARSPRAKKHHSGRFRKKEKHLNNLEVNTLATEVQYSDSYQQHLLENVQLQSDQAELKLSDEVPQNSEMHEETSERSEFQERTQEIPKTDVLMKPFHRADFKMHRSRDRRIRQKTVYRPLKNPVNIQDLLKEGQEVLVQVSKDPIATKGARLTCHISLPGRHLVCMPTIDHVGVSRRIEKEEERRRLREYVEKNRPRHLGFIVRTASGKQQSEKRIKQDIDYLTRLWNELKEKTQSITAPGLVYEDLNAVLRAIRDWVTEDVDKVIVDSKHHYQEVLKFVSHFMPALKQKVELYHGDIPIFDAYNISTELSRALEKKVWLKSGGYIVIDQAEALVAIDVNTGRYVGKKNLEDTILKTNLEAVQEIAYQLRLRNCGGIIILDFIDMAKDENKQRVYRALEDALSRDRARPSILKISELGLVEMTRKRTRDTIVRTLCESCSYCEGKGFIKSKQTVAYEVLREIERACIDRDVGKILVQAHSEVIDLLAIDERDTLDQMEKRYRKMIYLQVVSHSHPEQFEVTADKRTKESYSDRLNQFSSDRSRSKSKSFALPTGGTTASASKTQVEPSSVVEVFENKTTKQEIPLDDSLGNRHEPSLEERISSGSKSLVSGNSSFEDSFEEEDRLAFLRAQAAQDAALAQLGNGPSQVRLGHEVSPRQNVLGAATPAAPRKNGRHRRGSKFRRSTDRHRKPYHYGSNYPKKQEHPAVNVRDPVSVDGAEDSKSEGDDSGRL